MLNITLKARRRTTLSVYWSAGTPEQREGSKNVEGNHGRSLGQIFAEANMLDYVLGCVCC